ncbi:hypothetical protein PDIG_10810 [Penicillium digitatum PHI26]|uniref:Uncharacterized protein n=2 Tax=Penicillium digitatum TaxID=36651 RepID=K9GU37_PEND2|nr:hypothetical protein PDIP_82320 [Penicillium digitatum Pd1]EKV05633.1 hypothetical protein PDIP_82320 [Penicillium digitatum Pd1]EKV18133.1 hypothetical protein PDIG_10810 [Penicillium digitatum PHI26]
MGDLCLRIARFQDCKRREGRGETALFVWVLTMDKMSTGKQRQLFSRSRCCDGDRGIPDRLCHALHVTIISYHSPGFSGRS